MLDNMFYEQRDKMSRYKILDVDLIIETIITENGIINKNGITGKITL